MGFMRKNKSAKLLIIMFCFTLIVNFINPFYIKAASSLMVDSTVPFLPVLGNDGVARGVPQNSDITINFNENISLKNDVNTLINSNLIRIDGMSSSDILNYYDISVNQKALIFKFKSYTLLLNTSTWYNLHIDKSAIAGEDGTYLTNDISYRFVVTGDNIVPKATITDLNGYSIYYNFDVNGSIKLNFNKDMNMNTVNYATYGIQLIEFNYNKDTLKRDLQTSIPLSQSDFTIKDNRTIVLKPSTVLKYCNKYRLTIPRGFIRDTAGNFAEYSSVDFYTASKTGLTALTSPSITTDTGINITENNVRGVLPSSKIIISFDRDMTIDDSRGLGEITLKANNIPNITDVAKNIEFETGITASGTAYTNFYITPQANYFADGSYTLTIPSGIIKDRASNYWNGGVYTFRTAQMSSEKMGLYSIAAIIPSTLKRKYDAGSQIKIYGRNFAYDSKVSIIGSDLSEKIPSSYITTQVLDTGTIIITLPDTPRIDVVGSYGVDIKSDSSVLNEVYSNFSDTNQLIQLSQIDKPSVTDINLLRSNLDEKSISTMYFNGEYVQYMQITLGGKYTVLSNADDLSNLTSISISKVNGADQNFVDTSKINEVLSIKDAAAKAVETKKLYDQTNKILYLPIRTLDTGYQYKINIPAALFKNDVAYNDEITYTFQTMSVPSISAFESSSIIESYAQGSYIKIYCTNYVNPVIKFSKDKDYYVYPDLTKSGTNFLIAALPQNPQLTAGNYKVSVINDSNHYDTNFDGFSVIAIKNTNGSQNVNSLGTIVKKKDDITFTVNPSSLYLNKLYLNLEYDLGKAKNYNIVLPYSSADLISNSGFYTDDFGLEAASFNRGRIVSNTQNIAIKTSTTGKSIPKGMKLASKLINISLNNGAGISGYINISYTGNYTKTLSVYYLEAKTNKWVKLSSTSKDINKADRTISAKFDSKTNSNMYFAVFR